MKVEKLIEISISERCHEDKQKKKNVSRVWGMPDT